MPTDKLYPAYVKIDYQTPYAPHVMTRPTLLLTSSGIGVPGTFDTHAGGTVAADVMVEAFIDAMMDCYYTDSTSVAYTIYRVPSIGADPEPVFGKNYAAPGTLVIDPDDTTKAWVATMQFRTTLFGLAKLNLIEAQRAGSEGKQTGALAGVFLALANEFCSTTKGWAGQDNGRPAVYLNTNYKPNDRLIREYRGLWQS